MADNFKKQRLMLLKIQGGKNMEYILFLYGCTNNSPFFLQFFVNEFFCIFYTWLRSLVFFFQLRVVFLMPNPRTLFMNVCICICVYVCELLFSFPIEHLLTQLGLCVRVFANVLFFLLIIMLMVFCCCCLFALSCCCCFYFLFVIFILLLEIPFEQFTQVHFHPSKQPFATSCGHCCHCVRS